MVITVVTMNIDTSDCFSLKEKRSIISRLKDSIKHKFNVSVAEVESLDSIKNGVIAIALVSKDTKVASKVVNNVVNHIEKLEPGRLIEYHTEYQVW